MSDQPEHYTRCLYSIPQTARLLGLRIRDFYQLVKNGEAPKHVGSWPFVCYCEDEVKKWAIANIHAPSIWFHRFDGLHPYASSRCRIERAGNYFVLCRTDEKHVLRELALRYLHTKGRFDYQMYRPDSPAFK